MADSEKPRILQDMPFTELIELKCLSRNEDRANVYGQVERELRHRYADFRDYIDRFDALTPEQQLIAGDCMSYRMALGAVNRTVQVDYEPQERAQETQARIRRSMAARAIQSDASERIARLQPARDFHAQQVRQTLEEYGN